MTSTFCGLQGQKIHNKSVWLKAVVSVLESLIDITLLIYIRGNLSKLVQRKKQSSNVAIGGAGAAGAPRALVPGVAQRSVLQWFSI